MEEKSSLTNKSRRKKKTSRARLQIEETRTRRKREIGKKTASRLSPQLSNEAKK